MKTPRISLVIATALAVSSTLLFAARKSGNAAGDGTNTPEASPLTKDSAARSANVSYDVAEIVRMFEAGVDSDVIRAYAEKSATARNPTAEEIIYLHQHGISSQIVTALIHRGAELSAQTASINPPNQAQPAQASPPTVVANYLQVPDSASGPVLNYPVGYHYPGYYYNWYPGYTYSYYSLPLYYGYSYRPCYRTYYPWTYYRSCSPWYSPRLSFSVGVGAARFHAVSPTFGRHGFSRRIR